MKILLGKKIKRRLPWDPPTRCACGHQNWPAVGIEDPEGEIAKELPADGPKPTSLIVCICPDCGIAVTYWE